MTAGPTLAERLATVHEQIERARMQSPHRQRVRLIGVSKRHTVEALRKARDSGLVELGESYAQELRDKRSMLAGESPPIRWHFIGPLQSNKTKLVIGASLIHSIDRPKLLDVLEARVEAPAVQPVLVQVNLAGEPQKSGASPHEVGALLDRFADLGRVRCRGLMTIPPRGTPEQVRQHFAALRALRDQLARTARPGVELEELSMGMSADYEVAVQEGATLVRVGTAIFGPRPDL